MPKVPVVLVLSIGALGAACATRAHRDDCADCAKAQRVVESVAEHNPDITRLSLHSAMGGSQLRVCASTRADKRGTASDPEDRQAIDTDRTIVLDEPGAIDVTVPTHRKNGRPTAACGVTLNTAGMTRDQAIAKATTIAKAVEAGVPECCVSCGK